jgi:hypothetical protein
MHAYERDVQGFHGDVVTYSLDLSIKEKLLGKALEGPCVARLGVTVGVVN